MSKNRSPAAGSGRARRPAVGDQVTLGIAVGIEDFVPDEPVVFAGHLQPGLPLGALERIPAHPVQAREVGQPANARLVGTPAAFSARR